MLSIYLQWEWKLGKKSQVKFGNLMGSVMWQGKFPVLQQWPDITPGHQPVSHRNSSSADVTGRFLAGFTPTMGQGTSRKSRDITSPPQVLLYPHHTPSTCARTCVTQTFQNNIPGKTQLLASNSNTPKHHKSRCFPWFLGFQNGTDCTFEGGIEVMRIFWL